MKSFVSPYLALSGALLVAACGSSTGSPHGNVDAGAAPDTGAARDGARPRDGSAEGAASSGKPDAGSARDAGSVRDAGHDAARDAGHDSARARDGQPESGRGPDAGAPADAAAEAGDAEVDGGPCPPGHGYGGGESTMSEGSVTAKLVDETRAPVAAGQPLFICGIDLCSAEATTTAGGLASITTSLSMKKPAFRFGDGLAYASFGVALSSFSTDFTAMGTGRIATAKLTDKPGAPLAAGTSATSGEVTLKLSPGTTIAIDTLVYGTPESQLFRAVGIPLTDAALLLPTAPAGFALLYGVAPTETLFCPPAEVTVSVPATLGWQPGAAVEFWVTSTDTGQVFAPYAGWALLSTGAVSADGKSVSTAGGAGFAVLENFAVRLKN